MSNTEPGVERFSPETIPNSDMEDTGRAESTGYAKMEKAQSAKEEELISMETLRESPEQWPERFPGINDFVTMSHTPIHTPNVDRTPNMTKEDMDKINQLMTLTPDQLLEKIKSMQDEIYQLGLRESKEMTRGKILGIFNRPEKGKK
ncbi:protein lin-52 homolog [Drosophila grimshawi]|uniref:GH16461 n=1 Tax=Drosophila grimshawi TaxID=7222 RepID=B4J0F6_DROGR|nr:protein lin-52 homolog [Drosophila grimshawi]EDV96792.1 GH16461 [Drosophila grimshawi]